MSDPIALTPSHRTMAPQSSAVLPIMMSPSEDQAARMRALKSFSFCHSLGDSPMMSIAAIRNLTKLMLEQGRFDQVFFDSGLAGAGPTYANADNGSEILEALNYYESRRAWLRLTRVDEITPEFKDVVDQFYQDISSLHKRDIKRDVVKTFVTLFVSSPGAVTPYHFDHTWNYLLQISGHKTVHLFDPNDPLVITQQDREDWYTFRTQPQNRGVAGIAYDLGPGDGVHHPVNAPHWVQNGSEVSISLSLGLCLRQSMSDARVYQMNCLLRRFGLNPQPPRRSAWRDALKGSFIGLLSRRSPKSFDQVLFSGIDRWKRCLNMTRVSQSSTKNMDIT